MTRISKGKEKKPNIVQQSTVTFSGPIPPPEVLGKYEELKSGLAERIVKMAELQGEHRRELESKSLNAQIEHIKRRDLEAKFGQIFAFVISISAIITGGYIAMRGSGIAGTFIGSLGLGVVVTAFVYGRKKQNK